MTSDSVVDRRRVVNLLLRGLGVNKIFEMLVTRNCSSSRLEVLALEEITGTVPLCCRSMTKPG